MQAHLQQQIREHGLYDNASEYIRFLIRNDLKSKSELWEWLKMALDEAAIAEKDQAFVTSVNILIMRSGTTIIVRKNESTYIPIGTKHRLQNKGKMPLQIIEVQVGDYLEEDDIERFEDIYDRDFW